MTNPRKLADAAAHSSSSPTSAESAPPAGCPVHPGAVSLAGPRFQRNPAQVYREIRRQHGPVAPVLFDGEPAWLVLGYRELHYVTSHPELYARDSRRWHAWDHIPPDWPSRPMTAYQPSVFYTEGREHQRRAGALDDALAGVDLFELRANCERIADQLIDDFAGTGEADLMAQYAHLMPVLVAAAILGLPEEEIPALLPDMLATLDAGPESVAGYARLGARMERLLARKRSQPGADVPSRLLAHPAGLTDEEIIPDIGLVALGGQQPSAYWIGNTLRLMLTDSRFAVTLSGGRRSVGQALNEVLWEDTPSQNFAGRWATRPTQLGGQRIQTGDMLVLGLAAANADPQARPDSASGPGGNHAHMAFSHGEHRCPYSAQEIAEVIARSAVEVLIDRLPDVTLAVAEEALVWRPSVWMRGLAALPVEFTPTR